MKTKSSKDRFGVVLVGAGKMGQNHLRVLSENSSFELKAIVDPQPNLPKHWQSRVPILSSLSELGQLEFDCAVVASPTQTHFENGKTLIEMGKHLLMEKPLAKTYDASLQLFHLAREKGVVLGVGHVERFNPVIRKLKEVLEAGWLGQPIHFSVTRVGGYPNEVKDGNNVLLDLAVHDLDILGTLIGPIKLHSSICHSTLKTGIFDTAEILVKSDKGVSASIHVNWITPTKLRSIRVTGTKGVCVVDYVLQTCVLYGGNLLKQQAAPVLDFKDQLEGYRNTDKIEFGIQKEEPLKVQLDHFVRAMRGEANSLCSGQDASEAVKLAEEAISKG